MNLDKIIDGFLSLLIYFFCFVIVVCVAFSALAVMGAIITTVVFALWMVTHL